MNALACSRSLFVAVGCALLLPLQARAAAAGADQNLAQSMPASNPENLPPDAALSGRASAPAQPLAWWYRTPATKFWEGLPLATGRFGAMVYGRVRDEIIPFNDETLWTGQPYNPINPRALPSLPEIRRLLAEGSYGAAAELAANLLSHPVPVVQTYQAMGRLHLRFDDHAAGRDYRRELDLDEAMARVSYEIDGARYTREVFASYPDQVVVVRLTCDRPGRLALTVGLSSLHPSATGRALGTDTILLEGGVSQPNPEIPSRMRWQARVRARAEGGAVRIVDDAGRPALRIAGADAVTLVLAGATNYVNWNDLTASPDTRCADTVRAVAGRSYAELRRRHVADYQPLFRACQLDLGRTPAADEDTTTRMDRLRAGGVDPFYTAQYFQYGRYLLIADSRPGTMAFNNHNIWLDDLKGRWRGRWTLNINIQECYWPAENTNLASTTESLLSFIEDLAASGARTARGHYGARGWTAHHGTDVWMNTAMTDRVFHGMAPTMGIWLVQHLWEHYLYAPDPAYLARIYPLLKGAAEFGLDLMVPHRNGKWLVTSPSGSPENGFVLVNGRALRHGDPKPANGERNSIAQGVAMDTQLLRDVFRQVSTAAEQLGVDPELRAEIARALPRLPPDQIRADGTLQEWLEPYLEYDPKHRHVSHLYAAYPSNQITRRGPPDLVQAVRKTLVIRNDPAGWTGAWKINLHARLGQAEEAYRVLHRMQTDISKHPAPEDSDRVPSLEGNQAIQGFTAGVAELLLQSHVPLPGTTTRFELELLPALPRAWATGSVRGLRARGGWEVDLAWRDGRLANATLRATHAGPVRLRTGEAVALQRDGRPVATRPIEAGCVEFAAEAGAVYTITGGGRR
jgi:alpha-L-fucosidase 2